MINKMTRAYARSKMAIIQCRIEQLDEELSRRDGEVNKISVRMLLTMIRQEAEALEQLGERRRIPDQGTEIRVPGLVAE